MAVGISSHTLVAQFVEALTLKADLKVGSVYSLDWTTGLDYWTGLLDWTTGLTQNGVKCPFQPFSV